jgi:CO dehydrogenase maturation factor
MKIAFVGKGGSGKTTLTSLFTQRAASLSYTAMVYDADVNQRLHVALGIPLETLPKPMLGESIAEIKDYLRGTNPLIPSANLMLKTTPAGHGSIILEVGQTNPFYDKFFINHEGIRFAATGEFKDEDLGKRCYHSKTAAVELILGHLVDRQHELVIVDMVAGAEIFGSGLFTRFDAIVVVVEPTEDSLGAYRQVVDHASTYDIDVWAIGNKVEDRDDLAFLSERIDEKRFAAYLGKSSYVKAAARGNLLPFEQFEKEEENVEALDTLLEHILDTPKDWARFNRLTKEFHRRAVSDWGAQANLPDQITDFELGEHLLEVESDRVS